MTFSALILAGGESRRMGRDKAFLERGGTSWLLDAIRRVEELSPSELFVSGRPGADYGAINFPVLFDLEPGLGPLGGVERGLHACGSDLLLILAVDMPQVTVECLRTMLSRCNRLTGAVPRLKSGLEPLAAIYPRRCYEIARNFVAQRKCAAREFAHACLRERAVRPIAFADSQAGMFANWNTPEDALT